MEKIIQNLKEVLKSSLITVAEYGKRDSQYVVIVDKLEPDRLKEIKPLIEIWFKQAKKVPLFLTKEELTDGLDVFPLEFLNMKLNHKILYGEDVFKDLTFDKKHVRRELEFEFRSKLINIRQGYLEAKSKKELKLIIEKAVPTLMPILSGLLFLKNVKVHKSLDEILNIIGEKYKVNPSILKELQEENSEDSIKELIILLSTLGKILDEMKI